MTRAVALALLLAACAHPAPGERRSHLNIEKPERPHGSTLQVGIGGRRM